MLRKLISRSLASSKYVLERNLKQLTQSDHISRENRFVNRLQNLKKIDPSQLSLQYQGDTDALIQNVPKLQHGLDKYFTGELVFGDKGVGKLPQFQEVSNEEIQKISGFIQPNKDLALINIAKKTKAKYISSTSSISSPLTHLYYIFTRFRAPRADGILEGHQNKQAIWMISMRKPITFYLHKVGQQTDSIVADQGVLVPSNSVLLRLGHVIQYFLTHTHQQTDKLIKGEEVKSAQNYYRYAKVNNQFLIRSQIDCMSYDENGKPFVFQIKSRACAPIRYDIQNYKQYKDYQINSKRGLVQSFQREYYDLIRGAFLKYILQVKIGKMDGAFIAYHNTQKIYGYQYVKKNQMAYRVFGDEYNLDVAFVYLLKMLSIVLNHIRESLPEHKNNSLKIGFYSQQRSKKLIAIVEGMSQLKSYTPLKELRSNFTTTDYFQKIEQINNPVYKFQFDFQIYVNGSKQNSSQFFLTSHDTLQIGYHTTEKKRVSMKEYITFLYQGYKNQQVLFSSIYKGLWGYKQMHSD